MNRTIVIAPALVLLAVGCGQGGSYTPKATKRIEPAAVRPGEEASLLPLKVGNQWVYTVEVNGQTQELTLKVTDVREEGGAKVATLLASSPGEESRPSEWKVDATGIYQVSERPDRRYDPPQPLVPFPLELYSMKKLTLTGPYQTGGSGPMELTIKYIGAQEVDTDMERLSALAVESVTTWTQDSNPVVSQAITWWAPGIGFVRQRQQITTSQGQIVATMKLKSYTFP